MKPTHPTFLDLVAAARAQRLAGEAVKAADERQQEKENPLPACFACGFALDGIEECRGEPAKHITFTAGGCLTSAVWDSTIEGLRLEIAICDECVRSFAQQARVRYALSNGYLYGKWLPGEDPQATIDRLTSPKS